MSSSKTWVMEVHGPDDIRTFNSIGADCDGWAWTGSLLVHQPADYEPLRLAADLRVRLEAALAAGVFPVDVPYCGSDLLVEED